MTGEIEIAFYAWWESLSEEGLDGNLFRWLDGKQIRLSPAAVGFMAGYEAGLKSVEEKR